MEYFELYSICLPSICFCLAASSFEASQLKVQNHQQNVVVPKLLTLIRIINSVGSYIAIYDIAMFIIKYIASQLKRRLFVSSPTLICCFFSDTSILFFSTSNFKTFHSRDSATVLSLDFLCFFFSFFFNFQNFYLTN